MRALRYGLLGLLAFSIAGTLVELVLLDHLEDFEQQLPFYVLAVGVLFGVAMLVRPAQLTVRLFQLVMVAFIGIGALGIWYHYRGNVEFELEMYPTLQGFELFWKALEGATPTLAPGLMVQLGLLGLACTYAHPALHGRTGAHSKEEES